MINMNKIKPRIQVALDLLDLEKAVRIGKASIIGGVDILEAGTPLIEKFGVVNALRELKKIAGDKPITADLKIADAGYISAKIAFEQGANIITVLAAASDKTIQGVVEASKEFNGEVMADLIVSKDFSSDIDKVLSLDVNYVLVHTGLDEQSKGKTAIDELVDFVELIPEGKLAVAGGINPKNISSVLRFNPNIIIVGGAITKSDNPVNVVKKLREIIANYY